jgi:hypothetical protein
MLFDGGRRIRRAVGFYRALVGFALGVDRGVSEKGHKD